MMHEMVQKLLHHAVASHIKSKCAGADLRHASELSGTLEEAVTGTWRIACPESGVDFTRDIETCDPHPYVDYSRNARGLY